MDEQPLILVVEENIENLELLNSYLKSLNFLCLCTTEGLRALILVQSHQPNLILLSIKLPYVSGIQVINYLKSKSETATIPIIAVTDSTTALECNSIILAGADDCISKPYDFEQLEVVIRQHLNQ